MEEDGVLLLFILAGAGYFWWRWYRDILVVSTLGRPLSFRHPLLFAPLLCGLVLFRILRLYAAHDVRNSPLYLCFYMALGALVVGACAQWGFPILGLSARDDAVERQNRPALHAIVAALMGCTLCFAGGNIGNGPGWWVVVFCAALSLGAFFLLWLALAAFGRAVESITIDRRPSAAFRTGGFFVACGLVLGRAVAGDWISADATLMDFLAVSWPLLILLGLAVALERLLAGPDKPETGVVLAGILPGLAWIFLSSVYLARVGMW